MAFRWHRAGVGPGPGWGRPGGRSAVRHFGLRAGVGSLKGFGSGPSFVIATGRGDARSPARVRTREITRVPKMLHQAGGRAVHCRARRVAAGPRGGRRAAVRARAVTLTALHTGTALRKRFRKRTSLRGRLELASGDVHFLLGARRPPPVEQARLVRLVGKTPYKMHGQTRIRGPALLAAQCRRGHKCASHYPGDAVLAVLKGLACCFGGPEGPWRAL